MPASDTIAAIVTPQGRGGVGLIRVSGKESLAIAGKVIKTINQQIRPQEVHLGEIEGIDSVIYYYFKSPKSYTGEDVIEIGCHGSMAVLRAALNRIIASGARQARPGEFSFRAYLNGKIDLAQAEAILELVNAKTEKAAKLAYEELSGTTSAGLRKIRVAILAIIARVEGTLDFPDDIELGNGIENALQVNIDALGKIIEDANRGTMFREGARVAIIGRPNVGKSTLLNKLLKWERAIVSHEPGTTRDTITESLEIDGVPIRLVDTAGIEEGKIGPEGEGIDRAKREAEIADLILVVLDGSREESAEDLKLLDRGEKGNTIVVVNKSDLAQKARTKGISVSALTGDGVEKLDNEIVDRLGAGGGDGQVLISQRQLGILVRAKEALQRAQNSVKIGIGEELLAIDLRSAVDALDEGLGLGIGEEVVRSIFDNFCVGK
ncbi:tRNA uridine-5-carboxymethylaminomethyl(34) synthesis GTPase MnmE [Candidatus Saganbacteria bacterium]|nr:tRNA uridine-5-carboxymethylaminomethyl(34) synthesis GTPase MnmE [Candidatus Saganbacteria bacterium]